MRAYSVSGTVEEICVNIWSLANIFLQSLLMCSPEESEPAWRGCSSSNPEILDTQGEKGDEHMNILWAFHSTSLFSFYFKSMLDF